MKNASPSHVPVKELSRMAAADFPWLNSSAASQLARYISELLTWNAKINLIGKQDWLSAYRFLVQDSLHLAELLHRLDLPEHPLSLDLGAGAGLPGIPLRIVWPPGECLLVEPRQKRSLFLHHAVRTLDLQRTHVRTCRVGDLDPTSADLILSRAMCPWDELLPKVRPLLAPNGRVIVFSNQSWGPERICPPGWRMQEEVPYPVQPDLIRYFWVFSPIT